MHFAHTMVRIRDIDKSLHFYCNLLGLVETRRTESEKGRFTLIFLAAPEQADIARATKELARSVKGEQGEKSEAAAKAGDASKANNTQARTRRNIWNTRPHNRRNLAKRRLSES